MIKEIWKASNFDVVKVTRRYIRFEGDLLSTFPFKVLETTDSQTLGVRQYLTDGENVPEDIKEKAILFRSSDEYPFYVEWPL